MKIKQALVTCTCCSALLLSSCYDAYLAGPPAYNPEAGYNTSVAWTSASYDANGYPIYGYSYGRPVYGYTSTGAAIFTVAALSALCFVPDWGAAPWYHGDYHHPHGAHPHGKPPHHPSDHKPHDRPHGGVHAPIHRDTHNVFSAHPRSSHGMNHGGMSRGGGHARGGRR